MLGPGVTDTTDGGPATNPHAAHGVDGEVNLRGAQFNGPQLDGVEDVAHPVRTELDGVDPSVAGGFGDGGGGECLAGGRSARHSRGEVHRRPEVVAIAGDHGPVVEPTAWLGEGVGVVARLEDLPNRVDPRSAGSGGEHDGVADGLDELSAARRDRLSGRAGEHVEQVDRGVVAVGLGEGGEPGEVDERDRPLHGHGHHFAPSRAMRRSAVTPTGVRWRDRCGLTT